VPPLYARNLFSLLKLLDYPQQTIAKLLRVSNSSISLWARGHRPIPSRYHRRFFKLLVKAMVRHYPTHNQQIRLYVSAWVEELYVQLGQCASYIQQCAETLQDPVLKTDPLTLDPEERAKLRDAAKWLMVHLDYLDRVTTHKLPNKNYPGNPFTILQVLCQEFGYLPERKAWDEVFTDNVPCDDREGLKT
jgi:transcriptional regulator with XRE-family HTH domain